MYYNTPKVGNYINFIIKNRLLFILLSFLVAFIVFNFINPKLFSSDERIWLQDSKELERTLDKNLESQHVSKISLHVDSFDIESIETLKKLDAKLNAYNDISHVSSFLSLKHFYNDKTSSESQLLKVVHTQSLNNEELQGFIENFSEQYKAFIDVDKKMFILYFFTKESFHSKELSTEFNIDIEQISSADDKLGYMIIASISTLIMILLFKLIFKSFAAPITVVIIVGMTLLFSIGLVQLLLPDVDVHIAMSLIIISISLLDYLYFYYRWHVSQYNADPTHALIKSLDRNIKPAFWTTTITVIGLAPLLLIDSDVIKVLCLSAIFASSIAYLLNISLLPALLSYFHIEHPKVSYGRYCYYFANKELQYKRKYLYFFLSISLGLIIYVAYLFLYEPNRFISNNNSHNVISMEVMYEDLNTQTIESLYRLEHIMKRQFETIENVESIATYVDKLLDIKKSHLPINDESLQEALFFIQMYGLDEKLIHEHSLPITIMLRDDSSQKADILKYLNSYDPLNIYFNDVDTLVSIVKMENSQVLLFTVVTAVLIISLFMGLIFRNMYMVLVAFLASTIPMAWFSYAMYVFQLPFSLEVLIAMIIALGLASDATIHFAYKYWRARFYGRSKKHSLEIVFFYGAIPVLIGSLVLAVTFYGLTFSDAPTLQLIGGYSAILILMSLAVDLFILPILLLLVDKYLKISIEKAQQ